MPTFFSDPPSVLYLVMAAGAFVAGGVWFNRRTRPALVVFGAVLGLIALVFLLDRVLESPREEAVRRYSYDAYRPLLGRVLLDEPTG